MTGIGAVLALERLGWRREAPAAPPARMHEPGGPADWVAGEARQTRLDRRLAAGLGSTREKGER